MRCAFSSLAAFKDCLCYSFKSWVMMGFDVVFFLFISLGVYWSFWSYSFHPVEVDGTTVLQMFPLRPLSGTPLVCVSVSTLHSSACDVASIAALGLLHASPCFAAKRLFLPCLLDSGVHPVGVSDTVSSMDVLFATLSPAFPFLSLWSWFPQ